MYDALITAYNEAIFDTDRAKALEIVQQALDQGASPEAVIFQLVVPAMASMMRSTLEDFDASLAQQWMTAQIANEVVDAMTARMASPPTPTGRIVIGTAAGDMHTLGKRIVIGCLKTQLIESIDLGVNVPPARFVDEAVSHGASVIAISAMMTHTATGESGPRGVRRVLQERKLEGKIKIVVGGAPFRFDPELFERVGADGFAEEGVTAGQIIATHLREASS